MKKSKLKNAQQNGMFKEYYKFELEFENGDAGNIYKKADSSGLTLGEEYEYTINDKGTIKIQTEYMKNQTYTGNNNSYNYYMVYINLTPYLENIRNFYLHHL